MLLGAGLTENESELLMSAFGQEVNFGLLFDSNIHTQTAEQCHNCIDGQGRTITIVKTGGVWFLICHLLLSFCVYLDYDSNELFLNFFLYFLFLIYSSYFFFLLLYVLSMHLQYIVGGIATSSWQSTVGDIPDSYSTIFTFTNGEIATFQIQPGREGQALFGSSNFGPAFGKYLCSSFVHCTIVGNNLIFSYTHLNDKSQCTEC